MKLFEVNTWPNYLRWLLFIPISLLASVLIGLFYLLLPLITGRGPVLAQIINNVTSLPATAFVAMYIVPKNKKLVGYIYFSIYLLGVISGIYLMITGYKDSSWEKIAFQVAGLIGTIATFFLIRAYDSC